MGLVWRLIMAAGVVAGLVAVAEGKEEQWRQDSAAAFLKGTRERVVVSDQGVLRLARAVEEVGKLDEAHVWDLARDRDGRVLAATGDDGRVFRWDGGAKGWREAFSVGDSQALAVVVGADGEVVAGTGPGGKVVRWTQGEKPRAETIAPGVRYVWDLARDARGTLWAATGPEGQLWKRENGGEWTRVIESDQPHLLSVVEAPDGSIYAGSDGAGLIYRVAVDGRVSVVYDAEPSEIHALVVGPDGAIYAASAASEASAGGRKSAMTGSGRTVRRVSLAQEAGKRVKAGENVVYRIDRDGGVREIFRVKGLLYALAWQGDRLLIGSGPEGLVYEVRDGGREWSSQARLDHGQVLSLLSGENGEIWMGAGDPGGVLRLEDRYEAQGDFESEVLDAGLVSRFGALKVEGDRPEGTRLRARVRTGNVEEPDGTWSGWSEVVEAGDAEVPAVPAGRFAQYRLMLSTSEAGRTPEVRGVTLTYRTVNQAPEVGKLTVPDVSRGDGSSRKPRFELSWEASDPNRDELSYRLEVRKEGWPRWVRIGGPGRLSEKTYGWDTTTVPDGVYRLRVTAADERSNPKAEALEGMRVSGPFVVDHQAPGVMLKVEGREVEARLEDRWTRLAAAEVAIDGGEWTPVFPEDGLFDSLTERLRIPLEAARGEGPRVVVVRAVDAAGNVGSSDLLVEGP